MSAGDETNNRKPVSRTLSAAAIANAVLWVLAIIALIFVIQRCPSAKGLFIILAAGLAAASALLAMLRKPR
jgi:hypothetical protein